MSFLAILRVNWADPETEKGNEKRKEIMEEESVFIKKRLRELADRSFHEHRYLYSDFLSLYGLSAFHEISQELSFAAPFVFGGCKEAERCMVRFGSEELFGYEEPFPIRILSIRPAMAKYAQSLSHRDFLGSVIGLGLEREKLGDIFVKENEACMFVQEGVADYIAEQLTTVKHTNVRVTFLSDVPEGMMPKLSEKSVLVSSNRIDGILSKLYGISREEAGRLIKNGCVFFDGKTVTKSTVSPASGQVVSVRGYGRFIFDGEGNRTKKDKLHLHLRVYESGR